MEQFALGGLRPNATQRMNYWTETQMLRLFRLISHLPIAVSLAACTIGDAPTDPDNPLPGDPVIAPAEPSFATDVQPIFNVTGCTSSNCHGRAARGDLDLRDGKSYAQLVGVVATQEDGIRVIPGNADDSYIVVKVEDRQKSGSKMPLGRPALSSAQIQTIRNWITEGAKNN